MAVFGCVTCGAALTAPVSRVAMPVHARQKYGNGVLLPALMEAGTYAVDPEPAGPPFRRWGEDGVAQEAAARGVFAPQFALSFGAPGAVVIAPGDAHGTILLPERAGGYCCGLDWGDGPNLACARCGEGVATRIDDCSLWQAVWLEPNAVRRLDADEPAPPTPWETLVREREGLPPVDPSGAWRPEWEAAVGAGLAHVLAASRGARVAVPDGLLTLTFGRALDLLLPSGPAPRAMTLAGPGLPGADSDLVLVPQHPQTGETWRTAITAHRVPLPFPVWRHLAFRDDHALPAVTGGFPEGVLRDDPLPPHPNGPFRPDPYVFTWTLARQPAVRQPWLREIHDRVLESPYSPPF